MTASHSMPLHLRRIEFEKVWGARNLERVPGIQLDLSGPIGETWELVDRDDHNSKVLDGPCAGRTVRGLMLTERDELLGDAQPTPDGQFPVLVKFLDAGKELSVQVHPTPAAAKRFGGEPKTEAWYILDAQPGAKIYLGLKPGTSASDFASVAGSSGVADLLQDWDASPGQFYFVPAGTVHAIGKGVTLVEVQQNSDTTYRVYDWGRKGLDDKPRELHIEQALHSIDYDLVSPGPVTPSFESHPKGGRVAELIDCDEFTMSILDIDSEIELETGGVAQSFHVLSGSGRLRFDAAAEVQEMAPGSSWLIPAVLGAHVIDASENGMKVLRVRTK